MKTFFRITVPMMATGVIAGAILSWVTIITELSSAILLYNSKTITLTLAIYTFVLRGNYGYAAALATLLSALTVISILIYMKITKSDEITLQVTDVDCCKYEILINAQRKLGIFTFQGQLHKTLQ